MKIGATAGTKIFFGLNTLIILCCLLGAPLTVWSALLVESVYGDFNGDGFADLAIGLPAYACRRRCWDWSGACLLRLEPQWPHFYK